MTLQQKIEAMVSKALQCGFTKEAFMSEVSHRAANSTRSILDIGLELIEETLDKSATDLG